MIKLASLKPLGQGSHRAVYRHPERDDRCLKVMTEDWRECDRRQRAGWLSRSFRPKSYFHENLGELTFSDELRRRVGPPAWDCVAQAFQMTRTDLGDALEVELIREPDGKLSPSLKQVIWKDGLEIDVEEAIQDFWRTVFRYGIFLQGRPDNVCLRTLEGGQKQLVAIDGFGLPHLIPVARYLPAARHRYLEKKKKRQAANIARLLKARELGGEVSEKGMLKS